MFINSVNFLSVFFLLSSDLVAQVESRQVRGSVEGEDELDHRQLGAQRRTMSKKSMMSMYSLAGSTLGGYSRWADNLVEDRTNDGPSAFVEEYYACKPPEQLVGEQFYENPEESGDGPSLRMVNYYDGMCTCDGGCCRIYQWLECDTDNNLPSIQCVCNQNTANRPGGSIPIGGPNDTGNGVGATVINGGSGSVTVINAGNAGGGATVINAGSGGATVGGGDRTDGTGATVISVSGSYSGGPSNGGSFQIIGQPTGGGTDRTNSVGDQTISVNGGTAGTGTFNNLNPTLELPETAPVIEDLVTMVADDMFKASYNANDCEGGSPYQNLPGFSACANAARCGLPDECCVGFFCLCANPGSYTQRCIPDN